MVVTSSRPAATDVDATIAVRDNTQNHHTLKSKQFENGRFLCMAESLHGSASTWCAAEVGLSPRLQKKCAAETAAQDRAAQNPASRAPISGDIVRVDASAKLLAVKTADGAEVKFTYTDQ